jgi:hypothetical protein
MVGSTQGHHKPGDMVPSANVVPFDIVSRSAQTTAQGLRGVNSPGHRRSVAVYRYRSGPGRPASAVRIKLSRSVMNGIV